MKPSEVNKVDPRYTSLDDYKTALAFLKLPNMLIYDEEKNKQRYISAYDMYIFLIGSLIPVVLSIISCIFILTFAGKYNEFFLSNSLLSYMWPWSQSLTNRLSSLGRAEDANIVTTNMGVASTIWLIWIIRRIISEIKLQGSFYITKMIFFISVITIITWWGASVDFAHAPSFGPTLEDRYIILSIKKLVLISFSYWMSGYLLTLTAPYLRSLLKKAISGVKRNSS